MHLKFPEACGAWKGKKKFRGERDIWGNGAFGTPESFGTKLSTTHVDMIASCRDFWSLLSNLVPIIGKGHSRRVIAVQRSKQLCPLLSAVGWNY